MTTQIVPATWRCIGPDMYGYIIEVICHPSRPGHLFARSDVGGLFFSDNAGESWSIRNNGLAPGMGAAQPGNRCARKWGYFWHIYDGRLSVSGLAIDPFDPDHMLLATGCVFSLRGYEAGRNRGGVAFGELFDSFDAGETWRRIGDQHAIDGAGGNRVHGQSVVFDPHVRNRAFLATTNDGVFASEDAGMTWRYAGLRGISTTEIHIHPCDNNILVVAGRNDATHWGAATRGGVYLLDVSTGNTSVGAGLDGKNVRSLTVGKLEWFAAAGNDGIWLSKDHGLTWKSIQGDLPVDRTRQDECFMAWNSVASPEPGVVYASSLNRLAISRNSGGSWEQFVPSNESVDVRGSTIGAEEFMAATSSIKCDPHRPERLYLTDFHGVWRSDDAGARWVACRQGLANTCIKRVSPLLTSSGASRIAVAQTDGGLQMSDEGVHELRRVMGFKNAGVYCPEDVSPEGLMEFSAACSSFAQHPADPNIIFAVQNQAQHGGYGTAVVVRTTDGGKSWEPCASGLPVRPAWFKEIVIDPFDPGILYIAAGFPEEEGGGVYISRDGARTWSHLPSPFARGNDFYSQVDSNMERALVCDPHQEGRLITAGRLGGIFESNDRGCTWRDITGNLPMLESLGIGTIMLHTPSGKLWAGLYDIGLWVLDNGNWHPVPTGNFRSAKCLCHDAGGTIYAGFIANWFSPSDSGILQTTNEGKTWQQVSATGLSNRMFSNIECDRYHHGRIYAGTIGNGVFVGDLHAV